MLYIVTIAILCFSIYSIFSVSFEVLKEKKQKQSDTIYIINGYQCSGKCNACRRKFDMPKDDCCLIKCDRCRRKNDCCTCGRGVCNLYDVDCLKKLIKKVWKKK